MSKAIPAAILMGIGQRMEKSWMPGRRHAIVTVGEGVRLAAPAGNVAVGGSGPACLLADRLQQFFRRPNAPFPEAETRASVLGHLRRWRQTGIERFSDSINSTKT